MAAVAPNGSASPGCYGTGNVKRSLQRSTVAVAIKIRALSIADARSDGSATASGGSLVQAASGQAAEIPVNRTIDMVVSIMGSMT